MNLIRKLVLVEHEVTPIHTNSFQVWNLQEGEVKINIWDLWTYSSGPRVGDAPLECDPLKVGPFSVSEGPVEDCENVRHVVHAHCRAFEHGAETMNAWAESVFTISGPSHMKYSEVVY